MTSFRNLNLRKSFRRWASSVGRSWELLAAKVRHSLGRGPAPMRLLLLSDGRSAQSEVQFDPIFRNRRELRDAFGWIVEHRPLDINQPPPPRLLARYDIIGFKLDYRTPPGDVLRHASHLAEAKPDRTSLVYFDGNDEMTIQWPGLLNHCDVYWKKHVFRDRSQYLRRPRGGTNLVEYALGEEADADRLLPPGEAQLRKIFCGSSIGLDQKIAALSPLLRDDAPLPLPAERTNDVVLRADVPDNWMGRLRRPAVEVLRSLQGRRAILLPLGRVPQDQYAREMMESRICVSPFGYGEICWRDFEAIAYGCLLFKPAMDHVESRPNIFKPFETCVPLAWDFSDLGEKLDYYLARPDESARMIARARQVMRECLQPEWYVNVVREMLSHLASCRSGAGSPRA